MFRTPLRDQIGRRVTIRVGQITWRGLLAAASAGWVELKRAEAIDPVTGSMSADGNILLPESKIDYLQAIPEEKL